jgi:hypothetical protein
MSQQSELKPNKSDEEKEPTGQSSGGRGDLSPETVVEVKVDKLNDELIPGAQKEEGELTEKERDLSEKLVKTEELLEVTEATEEITGTGEDLSKAE